MKTTLTAKLKLTLTPTEFTALRTTTLAYRDALNLISQYAFAYGKTSSRRRLQDACYNQIRSQLGLPAQLACNVPRQVAATYKGLWTKLKKNAKTGRKGYSKKCYKGLDHVPHYFNPTLTYNFGRDYSLKAHGRVSLRITVDADYTSQMCPRCGFTSRANRKAAGLLFVCQKCHYTLHADLVGARNIALRTLLIRQDWMSTGRLSVGPDVSDREAKAARLQRYAELRWSLDASSSRSRGVNN